MAYSENSKTNMAAKKPHNLAMDGRKNLTLSGVEEVGSFDDRTVVLTTSCGGLVIRGEDLSISRLSVDSGDVRVEGRISALCYEEQTQGGSFWARLFH